MAKAFALGTLIITGGILANIWAKPEGTRAAAEGVHKLLRTGGDIVLGK